MATKTTWESHGDVWVFEEGEFAKVTLRRETRQKSADFRVVKVINGALVLTDLQGISRYGWQGPVLSWSGSFEHEVESKDDQVEVKSEAENTSMSDGDAVSSGQGE